MEVKVTPEVTGPDAPGVTPPGTPQPGNDQPKGDGQDGLILGKFKSQADLEAAYKELEGKLGAPKDAPQDKPKDTPQDKPQDTPKPEDGPKYVPPQQRTDADREYEKATYGEGMAELFEKAGLHAKSVSEFFHQHGVFPQEAYDKLAAIGINKSVVDNYLAGTDAKTKYEAELNGIKAQEQIKEVKATVGGDEGYQRLMSWAMVNLNAAEQDAYNRVMNSGDVEAIKLAVAGLNGKYTNALGNDPQLIGGAPGAPSQDVFRSTAEVTAAMRDPRYETDPAYRADVMAKLGRSDVLKPSRK